MWVANADIFQVARRNGKTTTLTIDELKACEELSSGSTFVSTSAEAAVKRKLEKFNGEVYTWSAIHRYASIKC